jgi:hypothetical protein
MTFKTVSVKYQPGYPLLASSPHQHTVGDTELALSECRELHWSDQGYDLLSAGKARLRATADGAGSAPGAEIPYSDQIHCPET